MIINLCNNVWKDFVSGLGNVGNVLSGGLLGTIGSVFGLGTSSLQNKMSTDASKELMDYQYKLNKAFITDQREYDKPQAQMARLAEAGLNPNLVYGSGSVVGNTSSTGSVGLGKAPVTELSKYQEQALMLDHARAVQNLENEKKTGNLIDANVENVKADTSRTNQQTNNLRNDDTIFWATYDQKVLSYDLQNQLMTGKINLASETAKRLIAQTENDNKYTAAVVNQIGETIKQRWKQLDLDAKELGGKLKYWSQLGNAAQKQAKAALIQAVTGRELANLKETQWSELGQEMKRRLQNINNGLERNNSWIDIMNEAKTLLMGSQRDRINRQTSNDDMSSSEKALFNIAGSLLDF